jgi:hypothetical protein
MYKGVAHCVKSGLAQNALALASAWKGWIVLLGSEMGCGCLKKFLPVSTQCESHLHKTQTRAYGERGNYVVVIYWRIIL